MLSPQQFTIYRGLSMGGRDPDDDTLVEHIRNRPVTPDFEGRATAYGSHWTTDPDVSRTFALHAATNLDAGFRSRSVAARPRTGVVLEATVSRAPTHPSVVQGREFPFHRGLSSEQEVADPGHLVIEALHAHVHHLPANTPLRLHDVGKTGPRRTETHVRSVPLIKRP